VRGGAQQMGSLVPARPLPCLTAHWGPRNASTTGGVIRKRTVPAGNALDGDRVVMLSQLVAGSTTEQLQDELRTAGPPAHSGR
jgi:hypothetical protein